jgi:hypothetical protein
MIGQRACAKDSEYVVGKAKLINGGNEWRP